MASKRTVFVDHEGRIFDYSTGQLIEADPGIELDPARPGGGGGGSMDFRSALDIGKKMGASFGGSAAGGGSGIRAPASMDTPAGFGSGDLGGGLSASSGSQGLSVPEGGGVQYSPAGDGGGFDMGGGWLSAAGGAMNGYSAVRERRKGFEAEGRKDPIMERAEADGFGKHGSDNRDIVGGTFLGGVMGYYGGSAGAALAGPAVNAIHPYAEKFSRKLINFGDDIGGESGALALDPIGTMVSGKYKKSDMVKGLFLGPAKKWFKMADGGEVIGPGTETSDSVPIMGSDGEYMLNAEAVKLIGKDKLDELNELGLKVRGGRMNALPGHYRNGGSIMGRGAWNSFLQGATAGYAMGKDIKKTQEEDALKEEMRKIYSGDEAQTGTYGDEARVQLEAAQGARTQALASAKTPEEAAQIERDYAPTTAALERRAALEKPDFSVGGKVFGDINEAKAYSAQVRGEKAATAYRAAGKPLEAQEMETRAVQGRAAALQLKGAENQDSANRAYSDLMKRQQSGEITMADVFDGMNSSGFITMEQGEKFRALKKEFLREGGQEVYAIASAVKSGALKPEVAVPLMDKTFNGMGDMRGYTVKAIDKNGNITATDADGKEITVNARAEASKHLGIAALTEIDLKASQAEYWSAKAKQAPAEMAELGERRRLVADQRQALADDRAQRTRLAALGKHFALPGDIAKARELDISKISTNANLTPEERSAAVKDAAARWSAVEQDSGRGIALVDRGHSPAEAKAAVGQINAGRIKVSKETGERFVTVNGKNISVEDFLPPEPAAKEVPPAGDGDKLPAKKAAAKTDPIAAFNEANGVALTSNDPLIRMQAEEERRALVAKRDRALGFTGRTTGSDWAYRPR